MKENVLIVDNYDSFTYNLAQCVEELGARVAVHRSDEITVEEMRGLSPTHIIISPGPGRPESAGISCLVVRELCGAVPILGVCLGHQAIGHAFGARVVRGASPVHGKTSPVFHDSRTLFVGVPNPFTATRYHSLVVERESIPAELEVSGETGDGVVMGLRHREFPLEGVQFHPESILTGMGGLILANFLRPGAAAPPSDLFESSFDARPEAGSATNLNLAHVASTNGIRLGQTCQPDPGGLSV